MTAGQSFDGAMRMASSAVVREFELDGLLITVRNPGTREIAQFGKRGEPVAGSAMISQPVMVGGVRLGQIEMHSTSARPADLMRATARLLEEIIITLEPPFRPVAS
jgi:hypothetical protein